VKVDICPEIGVHVAGLARGFHELHDRLQGADIVQRHVPRNIAGDQFQEIGTDAVDIANFLDRKAGNARATARRDFDEPFLFQKHQCFAGRRPACLVAPCKLDGVEVIARFANVLDDLGCYFACDSGNE